MPKIPFYVPYDYYEEQNYDSKESHVEKLLDESQKNDVKEFADIDTLSGAVTSGLVAKALYDKDENAIMFYNTKNELVSKVSVDDIIVSSLITEAYYDKETKKIIIKFENGDQIEIDVADVVDIGEAGDGLEIVDDNIIKVKIDGASESYLTVGPDGIKLNGVGDAINASVSGFQEQIDAEVTRAQEAEAEINAKADGAVVDVEYDSSASTLTFSDYQGNVIAQIDTTDFIKGGLIERMYIDTTGDTSYLVIVYKVEGVEHEIRVDIGDIFEADNYYKKDETSSKTEIADALTEIENTIVNSVKDEENRAISAETEIAEGIAAEYDRAVAAENTIEEKIEVETARATSAETALDTKIEAETTRATGAEAELTQSIETEAARATSAETALDTKIEAETTRATGAEAELTQSIETEAARATSAETALDTKIEAETTRATGVEGELTQSIETETARATSAETALDTKIDGIVTSLTYEDTAVTGKYVSEVDEANGVINVERANVSEAPLNNYESIYDASEFSAITENEADVIDSGDTINQAFNKVETIIMKDEEVLANAVVDLNTRLVSGISTLEGTVSDVSDAVSGEITRAIAVESGLSDSISGEITRATNAETGLSQAISNEVTRATGVEAGIKTTAEAAVSGASYDSNTKLINLYDSKNNVVSTVDTTQFVTGGMIKSVVITESGSTSYLVITFDTSSGEQSISVDVGDIFEADNYYDKTAVDGIVSGLAYADTAVSGKYISEVDETSGIVSVTRENVSQAPLNEFESIFDTPEYSGAVTSSSTKIVDTDTINEALNKIEKMIVDNEYVIAQALNDIIARLEDLEEKTKNL